MNRDIFTPAGGPPQSGDSPSELPQPGQGPRREASTQVGPSREIYALMGEENIFRMLSDFYKELEKSPIRNLFPPDMEGASKKSAKFFVQVLGGPPLYVIDHGPPRMRARHLPFAIDEAARQVWLGCFERVLEGAEAKYDFPPQHLQGFRDFLRDFSAWMVNRA